jgi:thiol:disulfide interchange protein DsbD
MLPRTSNHIFTFFQFVRQPAIDLLQTLVLLAAIFTVAQASAEGFSFDDEPDDEFLTVEAAYQVTPSVNENQITFSWAAADGYYLYRHQFQIHALRAGEKRELSFDIPDGKIKFDEAFNKNLEVYYREVALSATLPDWPEPIIVAIQSQGCADAGLCYPPRTQYFELKSNGIEETVEPHYKATTKITHDSRPSPNQGTAQAAESYNLGFIILSALLGGMILNLMPCVFPVLSLKALHLASGSSSEHKVNGWAYTVGVVLSFCVVAGVIVAAKAAGGNLGWGFQLQQPGFVIGLIFLFFLLALNLFGLFEIGTSWMGLGQNLTQGNGVIASFFTGVLAAVVASPCTAPFMATAIGYTLTQGPLITALVFASLGFGMALPYLALSHSPAIAAKLPQPGPWMETFKQFLAFPLLFTCVWLLLVLGNQTSVYAATLVITGAVCLSMAVWSLNKHKNRLSWAFAALLTAGALKLSIDAARFDPVEEDNSIWQTYSEQEFDRLKASSTPFFVDLTADWCITCKVNERIALDTDTVLDFATSNNITMIRGDWTKPNPEISQLLQNFNRNGVPLYLMINGDHVEVLPQILSQSLVLDAMQRAVDAN